MDIEQRTPKPNRQPAPEPADWPAQRSYHDFLLFTNSRTSNNYKQEMVNYSVSAFFFLSRLLKKDPLANGPSKLLRFLHDF
jgi:hypothetical protein